MDPVLVSQARPRYCLLLETEERMEHSKGFEGLGRLEQGAVLDTFPESVEKVLNDLASSDVCLKYIGNYVFIRESLAGKLKDCMYLNSGTFTRASTPNTTTRFLIMMTWTKKGRCTYCNTRTLQTPWKMRSIYHERRC